jgi:hypothetical protein
VVPGCCHAAPAPRQRFLLRTGANRRSQAKRTGSHRSRTSGGRIFIFAPYGSTGSE